MDYGAMSKSMHFQPTLISSIHARDGADQLRDKQALLLVQL